MANEFWRAWTNRTPAEDAAIRTLNAARKTIIETIPNDELIAIYAKGSLVRRELTARSDVDTLTIVRHSRWLRTLTELHRADESDPQACFSGYSLWELKRNKRSKMGKPDRGSPVRILTHLKHYQLIYGTPIEPHTFGHQIDAKRLLKSTIAVFRAEFLPRFARKQFAFSDLVKQTFWLASNELEAQGVEAPHHWGRLAQAFPQDHIIHDALELRSHPSKDPSVRDAYIKKLETYLSTLEASYD